MATPSCVAVPRPSSSKMTNDLQHNATHIGNMMDGLCYALFQISRLRSFQCKRMPNKNVGVLIPTSGLQETVLQLKLCIWATYLALHMSDSLLHGENTIPPKAANGYNIQLIG